MRTRLTFQHSQFVASTSRPNLFRILSVPGHQHNTILRFSTGKNFPRKADKTIPVSVNLAKLSFTIGLGKHLLESKGFFWYNSFKVRKQTYRG
jgi:hypothetical protein